MILLLEFLKKNKLNLSDINNIFINQGPGKFSSLRVSISIAKAISLANKINLYGFKSKDIEKDKYTKIMDLYKKGLLIKDLIKPLYSS